MNSWNSKQAYSFYPSQFSGFLNHVTPTRVNIDPPILANTIRDLAHSENLDPNNSGTHKRAKDIVATPPPKPQSPLHQPIFGYVAKWVPSWKIPRRFKGY
jgi:hypothetical protein